MSKDVTIESFVRKALQEIKQGTPSDFLIGNINFEVTVTTQSSKRGKFDIRVIGAGGLAKNTITQKLNFSVSSKESAIQAQKQLENFVLLLKKIDKKK